MKVYLCGPMRYLPDENRAAFAVVAARLRAEGHEVVSPPELSAGKEWTRQQCLRADLAALLTCETILLLPGWCYSEGASLEVKVARACGIDLYQGGAAA